MVIKAKAVSNFNICIQTPNERRLNNQTFSLKNTQAQVIKSNHSRA